MIYVGDDHKKIGHILYEGNEVILGVINGKIVYQFKGIKLIGPRKVNTYDYGEYKIVYNGKEITEGIQFDITRLEGESETVIYNNTITFKTPGKYILNAFYKGMYIKFENFVEVEDITFTLS